MQRFFLILFCLLQFAFAGGSGKTTLYFLDYNDFLINKPVTFSQLPGHSFYQAEYLGKRLMKLTLVNENGKVEKQKDYEYSQTGGLKTIHFSHLDGNTKMQFFAVDSIQRLFLKKLEGRGWKIMDTGLSTVTFFDSDSIIKKYEIHDAGDKTVGLIDYEYLDGRLVNEFWFFGNKERVIEYFHFEFNPEDSTQSVWQYGSNDSLISHVSIRIPAK